MEQEGISAGINLERVHPPKTPPRRILQFFSRYRDYGGEEGSVYRIGSLLQEQNDLGTFITSSNEFFQGRVARVMAGIKAFRNWEVAARLRRYQKLGNYDVWLVHNVFPGMSPVVYEIAFNAKIPVIQYLHNYRLGCVNGFFINHGVACQRCMGGNFLPALTTACWHNSHLQSGAMGAITMRARHLGIFSKVAHWIALSQAQKEEHIRMGIPEGKISVISHFYEPLERTCPPYPQSGDVLFVGRLSAEKGVDVLLHAWKHVEPSGRTLFVVGEGPERVRLEGLVTALGLSHVVFTGFLDQNTMADLWNRSACLVVPSIWKEPFGMVVLEAWSKGRPVVAHRIGALPEIIRDGVDGCLAPSDDPKALARSILSVLEDPVMGATMGMAGRGRLENEFSKTQWMNSMNRIFDEVLPAKSEQP